MKNALTMLTLFLSACGPEADPCHNRRPDGTPPNIIFILADDLGTGDLGGAGHPAISTPNIDRIGDEGMRFPTAYATSLCSPTRAAFLTGNYPVRTWLGGEGVVRPWSETGMPTQEVTVAESLRDAGYRTMMLGKWHLGHQPDLLPDAQGFDSWLGIPWANSAEPPLMDEHGVIDDVADARKLTDRYTARARQLIRDSASDDQPFFLYYPTHIPHGPWQPAPRFRGTSGWGPFGDVVQELDWSVGQIVDEVDEQGLACDTVIVFTSDNGADKNSETTNGALRGNKNSIWEGGVRVPQLVRWTGHIAPGSVHRRPTRILDWFPTFAAWADASTETVLDGQDLTDGLLGDADAERPFEMLYFTAGTRVARALRQGRWKVKHNPDQTQLFDLVLDPNELVDLAPAFPELASRLAAEQVALAADVPVVRRDPERDR